MPSNIPFHASGPRAPGAGCLMAAAGMCVGHVRGPLGRSLNRRSLRRFDPIAVRDADSAKRLHRWGLYNAAV